MTRNLIPVAIAVVVDHELEQVLISCVCWKYKKGLMWMRLCQQLRSCLVKKSLMHQGLMLIQRKLQIGLKKHCRLIIMIIVLATNMIIDHFRLIISIPIRYWWLSTWTAPVVFVIAHGSTGCFQCDVSPERLLFFEVDLEQLISQLGALLHLIALPIPGTSWHVALHEHCQSSLAIL